MMSEATCGLGQDQTFCVQDSNRSGTLCRLLPQQPQIGSQMACNDHTRCQQQRKQRANSSGSGGWWQNQRTARMMQQQQLSSGRLLLLLQAGTCSSMIPGCRRTPCTATCPPATC